MDNQQPNLQSTLEPLLQPILQQVLDCALSTLPEPKVYPPWADFGLKGLNLRLIRERLLAFTQAALDNVQRKQDPP